MFVVVKVLLIVSYVALLLICRRQAKIIARKSVFSYRIVSAIGLSIFIIGLIFSNLLELVMIHIYSNYEYGFFSFYSDITAMFTGFSMIMFPLVVIFSVFLTVSNVILLFKEGKRLSSMLGIALGLSLILGTILLANLYTILENVFDVHSYLGFHVSLGLENIISITLCYVECMMAATVYVAIKCAHYKVKPNKDYVIVLGCHVLSDGKPGGFLKRRLDTALDFCKLEHKRIGVWPTLLFSGGKGDDENISEAQSMYNYALSKKYAGRMILEDQSRTTRQNFSLSKKLIETNRTVAFATTDFHVFRSGVIAAKCGFSNIEGISAKSPWYYYNNALVREFVANMVSEYKIHLFVILLLNIVSTILLACSYVFNIM